MYQLLNQVSQFFSEPIFRLMSSTGTIPLLAALLLGILGSLAPCQLTGNFTAITYFGEKAVTKKTPWSEILFFLVGKILVYSIFGGLIWLFGKEYQAILTTYFAYFRKGAGFINIIVGLFLLGYLKFTWVNLIFKWKIKNKAEGNAGAFLLGVSYSIAFCPTMFVLFFVKLMPMVLSTPMGFTLTPVFGIGTALPLLIILFLLWAFEGEGSLLKKGKKFGAIVQKLAGILIIIIGLIDIVTYW
ncbi:sulfite exporter TauE/SafE family protein [Peribacillus cavernae]|uniref:Sulfite exporter TauE/SafE family protein n=1 Tax=Peribacillus cavernae TaxID=1674310 RepID=A0A3S0U6R1_9BACI|nr:sulfite exporter TauE/SafE family protein [Peribacillus cavernae]MDQ0219984.1 cytochrome c biogenesis protein CcdA [Peribacillus cavernae]RUQ32049.1 sulfite exporter TauE/SafE family protein [Peribacillus cavernae]